MGRAIPEITPARTRIEQQAIDHLDDTPTTNATTLASQLAFELWPQGDAFADWHTKTPLTPMLRALFVRELLRCRQPDSPYTKTDHEQRIRDPGVADQLGFDLDEDERAPCRTTYDRTWRNRLDDAHRQRLAHAAERVRNYAHENGIPLGLDTFEGEIDDKSTASQSTKNRIIRRTTRQVLTQVTDLIFPLVDFGRADNAKYDADTYLGGR